MHIPRPVLARYAAERSSSEGWMIEDTFGFPDSDSPVRLVFGCENGETGEIYRQMADGIMGMGNNHNAFQSQVRVRGVGWEAEDSECETETVKWRVQCGGRTLT